MDPHREPTVAQRAYRRTLLRMQERGALRLYVVTMHAEEEMDEDRLTVFDIEAAILAGTIVERQKDRRTGQWKYLVRGPMLDGRDTLVVVVKFGSSGKLVIVTVYRI